jgi:hypothetical protein
MTDRLSPYPPERPNRLVAMLLALMLAASGPGPAAAVEVRCPVQGIAVEGPSPEDIADVCAAIADSAPFFAAVGLAMPDRVAVRLVDPAGLDSSEIGHYDGRIDRILVLGYGAAVNRCRNAGPGLGAIASRPHWRSYVVHELAHAAIHLGCRDSCPSRAVHEYVAAVAQLSSLPDALRADLLAEYGDLAGFEGEDEITEIYYAINPHYFAVKSYRHYLAQPDPAGFVRRLLRSRD